MNNNNLLDKKPLTLTIVLITMLLLWYTFFNQLKIISGAININFLFIVFTFLILFIDVTTNISKYLKISRSSLAWYLFLLYSTLNSFISPYGSEAIKWIAMLITIYAIRAIIIRNSNIISPLLKSFCIASSIHVFFIILQLILPDIVNSINLIFINADLTTIEMIQEGRAIKGINVQSAPAGIIATIFVGFTASSLTINKKGRIKQIIFLAIGILAIILTLKRSLLISSVIGLYFLAFMTTWDRRASRFFKILIISFVVMIGFFVSIETIPQLQEMVTRTMRVGNVFSGREQMFSHMMTIFRKYPIFGIGNGYADATYSYGSHNVYLQLLAESGIIGLILFTFVFVGQFIRNIKVSIPFIKKKSTDCGAKKRIYISLYMQVVFFVYCMSGNPLYDYPFMVMFIVFFNVPESEILRLDKSKT